MNRREITYRDASDSPWITEAAPGPLPQARTRKFPTSRTYCTCGHPGPSHNRQTLTTGSGLDFTGQRLVSYGQGHALRYRGRCIGHDKGRNGSWYRCPCSWFVEDLEYDLAEKYERAHKLDPATQALVDQYISGLE